MNVVTCETCGAAFRITKQRLMQSSHYYCSRNCYYAAIKVNNIVSCAFCGSSIEVTTQRFKTAKNHFCSSLCQGMSRRTGRSIPCSVCGMPTYRKAHQIRNTGKTFCSYKCMRQPRPHLATDGYIKINHNGKQVRQHRVVMESIIGRPLLRSEHVHHINGDRSDNRPQNLQLIDGREHIRQHREERWSMREAISLRAQGKTFREIGEILSASTQAVYAGMRNNGHHKPAPVNKWDRSAALVMIARGVALPNVASELGTTVPALLWFMKKHWRA